MEFGKIGQHCNFSLCQQQEFLPFECYGCKKIYCTDHSRPDDHQCHLPADFESIYVIICPICEIRIKIKAIDDPNVAWAAHSSSGDCKPKANGQAQPVKKCMATKCYTKLNDINSITCTNCQKQVCLSHRYPDDHQCKNTNIVRNQQTAQSKLLQSGYFKNGQANNKPSQPVINQVDYTQLQQNINRFSSIQQSQPVQQTQQRVVDDLSSDFRPEACPVCGSLFRDVSELIAHTDGHFNQQNASKKAETEKCPHCPKRFVLTELVNHLQQDHFIF
eukprot:403362491